MTQHTSVISGKKLGMGIYAGPDSSTNASYVWQVWLSITSGVTTKFMRVMPPVGSNRPARFVQPNVTNYVAVTCDGATVQLYRSFENNLTTDMAKDRYQALDEPAAFIPNSAPTSFYIGMGRDLFTPFPTTPPLERYPFHGQIQDVAIYREALNRDRIVSHIMAAFKNN